MGRVYRLKAYEIPESGRTSRGTAIVNLLPLEPGEKISAIIPIHEYAMNKHLFMVTKKGIVKKTPLTEFSNVRQNGIRAIGLREDDELIEVKITDADRLIYLVTKQGMCICFHNQDVRPTGRISMGVIGMDLMPEDEIIGMQLDIQGEALLIVSENGMGKKTATSEFHVQRRGGKGVKCYKITDRTGDVVGVKAVNEDSDIMMITTEGILIQMHSNEISTLGRIASGVKMISVENGVRVAKVAKVRKEATQADQIEANSSSEVNIEEDGSSEFSVAEDSIDS
jgi:DNA gyrase subunit A